MRHARLGPSSVLVRVLIRVRVTELGLPCRGFTPLLRVQGWATHFSKQQQAAAEAAGGPKVLATALWLKTSIQVAQNDREANAHHHKQVSLHFEPSSVFYGRFSVQKWPFWGCFQDDCPENSRRSPVCYVGIFNGARCSSIAIGLSKECKSVFNKACSMHRCHAVVHFEVKMSRLRAVLQDDNPDCGDRSPKQAIFPPR